MPETPDSPLTPPVVPTAPLTAPTLTNSVIAILAALPALIVGLVGALTTWQSYQDGRATSRASYDTLKAASELHDAELTAQRQTLEAHRVANEELRTWLTELSTRLEKRQAATEKVLRKVKPAAVTTPSVVRSLPPPSAPLPDPPPPPPPAAQTAATESTPLPKFDALAK
jgi:flagellar motility protein MotE (MotC chaperone)